MQKVQTNNEVFADILLNIKSYVNESEQEQIEKDILIHEWQIFNHFFNLIDKNETNFNC